MSLSDLRNDPYEAFAGDLTLSHYDAAQRASRDFLRYFPGWELYARIVRGNDLNDRRLAAWAILCARSLARARKRNGRQFVSACARAKSGWVAQAGLDGLHYAIFNGFPVGLHVREAEFGVAHLTYQKLRDTTALCIWRGFESYSDVLHAAYRRVKLQEFNEQI